jgi:putative ABC transport system permease protein
LGRLRNDDDDRAPGDHRFGANSAILNQKAIINGTPMLVIGVAPAGFRGDRLDDDPQIFVPMVMKPDMMPVLGTKCFNGAAIN